MKITQILAVAMLGVVLPGCGINLIEKQPAPQIYDLQAPQMETGGEAVSWSLMVEEPAAIRALATNRIARKGADRSIEYYKGARWSDRAPRLVQARLIEALEDTGRIMSVGSQTSGINAKYRLKGTLREFHVDASGDKSTAAVTLSLSLLSVKTRQVVATVLIEKKVKIKSQRARGVVKAFDKALKGAAKDAAIWVLDAGTKDQGEASAPSQNVR